MTPPRTCAACGLALPASLRRLTRCPACLAALPVDLERELPDDCEPGDDEDELNSPEDS